MLLFRGVARALNSGSNMRMTASTALASPAHAFGLRKPDQVRDGGVLGVGFEAVGHGTNCDLVVVDQFTVSSDLSLALVAFAP
jgi:hypothetical protein